jgi:hypothetical protein
MSLAWLIFYSIAIFLGGYVVSMWNEARERQERERQKKQEPIKCFNFKL